MPSETDSPNTPETSGKASGGLQKSSGIMARSAARLAAVQALYQMEMAGSDLNKTIVEFGRYRLGKELDEGERLVRAHRKLFEEILRGVVRNQKELDPLIAVHLAQKWKLSRIDSTLRAILRAGTYELCHADRTDARVILSEYIPLAASFFDGDEPAVTNGVLNAIARKVRPEEFTD